jgi:hypothetical protein
MLERQIAVAKHEKKAQADKLDATLWWEKAERREKAQAAASSVDGGIGGGHGIGRNHGPTREDVPVPRRAQEEARHRGPTLSPLNGGGGGGERNHGERDHGGYGSQEHRGGYDGHGVRASEGGGGALEVPVLENAALRREAEALRRTVAAYETRFGRL